MNDVEMDKLIDLVEMAYKRVNLNIDRINVQRLLKRPDSNYIRDKIEKPLFDEKKGSHDSLLLKMVRIEKSHLVQ